MTCGDNHNKKEVEGFDAFNDIMKGLENDANKLKQRRNMLIGVIVGVVLYHFILFTFGAVDVINHCASDKHTSQILLLLFVPFYSLIYLFVRKTTCPLNRNRKKSRRGTR